MRVYKSKRIKISNHLGYIRYLLALMYLELIMVMNAYARTFCSCLISEQRDRGCPPSKQSVRYKFDALSRNDCLHQGKGEPLDWGHTWIPHIAVVDRILWLWSKCGEPSCDCQNATHYPTRSTTLPWYYAINRWLL